MFGSKKRDEAARQAELVAQNAHLMDAINRSMASIEFTADGLIVEANDNFLKTVGYERDEIVGRHHRIFCEPLYASSDEYESFWRQLKRGEFAEGRFKRVTKDGRAIWLRATYNPVLDASGQTIKIIKFATDITDTVRDEAEVAGKMAALSRSTAIVEFDLDGTIVDCNENFTSAVGYPRSDIIGKHHRLFCDSELAESAEYAEFWRHLNEGRFFSGKFKRVHANGSTLWLEASYNPVYDGEGKLYRVIKFATDVTAETEQAEQERASARVAYRISTETSETASDGGGVIEEAVTEMKKIASSVKSSSEHIDSLNKKSTEISSIINTIQGIADQTNLLALNAAIEAARAGEQGRGFAVVADEVRELAARTSLSTSEISSMITNIQADTSSATSSMAKCLEQAERGVDLANRTGVVISKIQQGANEVVSAIDQFSSTLQK